MSKMKELILARAEKKIHCAALPVLESHHHALKNFPGEEQSLFSTLQTQCQNLLPLCGHRRRCWVLLCGSEVFEGKVPWYRACSQSAVHPKATILLYLRPWGCCALCLLGWDRSGERQWGFVQFIFTSISMDVFIFFMWNRKKQTAQETLRDVRKGLTGGELLSLCLIADLIITTYTLFLSNLLHTLFPSCSVLIIY